VHHNRAKLLRHATWLPQPQCQQHCCSAATALLLLTVLAGCRAWP
jgi:hypothetical protein